MSEARNGWHNIWSALERIFDELPLVVRHKSKRQDSLAEKHLQEASAALAEATMALQSAAASLNSQAEHHQAVHLSRFLGFAVIVRNRCCIVYRVSRFCSRLVRSGRGISFIRNRFQVGYNRFLRRLYTLA